MTLTFLRPPRKVPAYEYNAVRHDNISSAGVREAVLERIETFLEFEMEWVAIGADVQAWNQFMQFALGRRAVRLLPGRLAAGLHQLLA